MTASTVMFDAYGTLFDVHSAVERAGAPLGPLAAPVSQLWRTKQLEYSWITTLMGGFDDFWTLTERGLDFALARHGISDASLRGALLAAYRTLDAYADVAPALERLRHAARPPPSSPTARAPWSTRPSPPRHRAPARSCGDGRTGRRLQAGGGGL